MIKNYLRLITALSINIAVVQTIYGQCAPPNPLPAGTHCDGQRAIFPIPATASGEEIEWYQDPGGTVSDGTLKDAAGNHVSRVDVELGLEQKDFWIRKKSNQNVGPAAGTLPNNNWFAENRFGTDAANNRYDMQLNATTDFTLNSLKVWVKGNTNTTQYGLRVRVVLASEVADNTKGTYSDWYKFYGGGQNGTGNNHTLPVGIDIAAGGPYIVQVISYNDPAAGVSRVNEFYYSSTANTPNTYLGGSITLESVRKAPDNTTTNYVYPVMNSWDVTVNCPLVKVTSQKTTQGCCTPIKDVVLTSPKTDVTDADFPLTLEVKGTQATDNNYYQWYDEFGRLVSGKSGRGQKTFEVNAKGTYRVRVIENLADTTKISCFRESPITLGTIPYKIDAKKVPPCVGDAVKLQATLTKTDPTVPNPIFVGWTTKDGEVENISNPADLTTWVNPTDTVTYVAKAQYQLGNLIQNPSFEGALGDGYSQDYTLSGPPVPGNDAITTGKYNVATNPRPYNQWFVNKSDHTTGTGKMYIVDADVSKNKDAYRTTVSVKKGVTYAFSFWIANLHTEFVKPNPDTNGVQPSKIRFIINNQPLIEVNTKPDTAWRQYVQTYTADADMTFNISLRNNADGTRVNGNDFALDDIVFAPLSPSFITDTVWVRPCVLPCVPPTAVNLNTTTTSPQPSGSGTGKVITVCDGTGTLATLQGGYTPGGTPRYGYQYSWYKKNTATSYTATTGTVPGKTLTAADSGIWVLRVEDLKPGFPSASCYKEDQVELKVIKLPAVTTKPATICGTRVNLDTLIATKTPANAIVSFYTSNTGNPTAMANTVVTTSGTYYARAKTATGDCLSDFVPVVVTIKPVPQKPGITVNPNKTTFCPAEVHTLTAASAGAGASATYAWTGEVPGNTAAINGKTTPGTFRYIAQTTENGCKSDTASQVITVAPAPTAAITGGSEVCKEATPSLSIALTGRAPFTVKYTDPASATPSLNVPASPGSITVSAEVAGTFTLTEVQDGNGCKTTTFTTPSTTVSRITDLVIVPTDPTCDFVTKKATVKFSVSGGKGTYTSPNPVPAAGTWSGSTYTAVFDANGPTDYDYHVSDASGCAANTNKQGPKGTKNCDCPVTGVIANKAGSPTSICNDGTTTTQITVTVAGSVQAAPVYDFVVKTPNGTLTKNDAASVANNVYTFNVKDKGDYTIQSVSDQSCEGSGSGTATVDHFPDPKASLAPTDTAFCNDGTDLATVTINVAPTAANYTVVVSRSPGGDTTITLNAGSGTIQTNKAQTFTLKSLTDGNGCSAKPADLTRPVKTISVNPPVAEISEPLVIRSTTTAPDADSYTFNTTPFDKLRAENPGSDYTGTWAVTKTSGAGTPVLTSSATSLTNGISGMEYEDVSSVTWTVADPKGVCLTPAVATLTLIRKEITEAKAKDDTICLSSSVYTQTPAETPKTSQGEVSEWIAVAPAPAPAPGNDLSVSFTATGIYQYTYRIYNPTILDGNGNPIESKNTYTIIVDDKPALAGITANDPACEGDEGTYQAAGLTTPFPNGVNYQWSTSSASAGNPIMTFNGPDDENLAMIRFASSANYLQATDSATVLLTVTNTCGDANASHPVIWKLKPRTIGTIGGPDAICETSSGAVPYGIAHEPNADTYNWDLSGGALSNTSYPGPPATDSTSITSANWNGLPSPVKLTLTLANSCGTGVSTDKDIDIIPAVPLQAVLTTVSNSVGDAAGKQTVCIDKYAVTMNASSPNAGSDAQYTYYLDGTVINGPTSDTTFTLARGVADQGQILTVKVSSQNGCFSGAGESQPSNQVEIDAYRIDSSLNVVNRFICDDRGETVIIFVNESKGNTGYTWSHNGTSFTGSNSISLTTVPQSGNYKVTISNSVCPDAVSNDTSVRIYDTPKPEFVPSPFIIYYDENSQGTTMPLVTTGTNDTLTFIEYTPGTWLNRTDSLYPVIKTPKEEQGVEYTLTIATGNLEKECRESAKIQVYSVLPLNIPNAFTPNGDGKNDGWVITGLGRYRDLKVRVFNRWGGLVMNDIDGSYEPWDGTNNGAPVPAGTYYYVIELKGSLDGKDDVKTGPLTVIR